MRVAIISGGKNKKGISSESGDNIFLDLHPHAKKVFNIKINENGEWSQSGIKTLPHTTLIHVDYVIDMTHDTHDEKTSNFIKNLGVRNIMSDEHDHDFVRKVAKQINIKFPTYHIIKNGENVPDVIHEKWRLMHLPIFAKSITNKTLTINTHNSEDLYRHILHVHNKNSDVLIDEMVRGKRYSVVTISKFRGEDVYATPLIEKLEGEKKIFLGAQSLTQDRKDELSSIAKNLHATLGSKILKHDYVISKTGPVLVNLETKPTYDKKSSFYHMLSNAGITFYEIVKSVK